MAYQSVWYFTDLPSEIVNCIESDLQLNFEPQMKQSLLEGGDVNKTKRNSSNAWIPTSHWVGGFIWNYIQRANRENFLYDLETIDNENLQYTRYGPGEFYGWHNDSGISSHYAPQILKNSAISTASDFINENSELIRKLSVVMQLSDSDDYTGGNLQFLDESGKSYFAPRKKGTVIVFDSRTQHRVLKVTSGVRKSLVGWVVGPRWK